jgi:uncharacterized protein YjbJ (UPF0337 family)
MRINKIQVKGRANEAIGKVKETVGEVAGNKTLPMKGAVQKDIGIVQAKIGNIKSAITKS